jgi:translation initiation factor eIF-2B subunit gamma
MGGCFGHQRCVLSLTRYPQCYYHLVDVLVICPTIHKHLVSHHIHSNMSPSLSTLHIDVKTFDETVDSGVGTCDVLRSFSDQITGDFVLLSCDFIPPASLPLSSLLNKFRIDSLDGTVLTACWCSTQKTGEKSTFAEGEWGALDNPTGIVWDEKSETLLHIDSLAEHDRDSEDMQLRLSMLKQ